MSKVALLGVQKFGGVFAYHTFSTSLDGWPVGPLVERESCIGVSYLLLEPAVTHRAVEISVH